MITAAHAVIYSADAKADRAVLGKILRGNRTVDAGDGWLIVALPPAEVAVHPTDGPPQHELYLVCDDIETTIADLTQQGVVVESRVSDRGWGLLTSIRLPGGGELGLYEPRHPVAADP
jgi:hypothetical protein